jgi:hypothetical protein
MSHSSSPFGDGFEPFDPSQSIEEIEKVVLDLEPKIRDLKRHMIDVLGACPENETGNWAYLARTELGEFVIGFEQVSIKSGMKLSNRFLDVYRILDDIDVAAPSSSQYQPDLGPSIVGDAASLRFVPSTHVRVVRK